MIREYSSISVETTLSAQMTSVQTTLNVAAGTGTALLGGVTLSPAGTYQFTLAIDPDTSNEEIVFATANSGDTFTIVRGQSQSTAITHAAGALVRHVLTASDLDYFNGAVQPSTLTAKGDTFVATAASTVTRLAVGSDGQVLTADSAQAKGVKWSTAASGDVTLTGVQTLTNKTLTAPVVNNETTTAPVIVSPEERTTVSATAATGTVNFDADTQGVLYYTTNASANWTLNFRGSSSTTMASKLAVGDSFTGSFIVSNGSTAYYPTAVNVDGTVTGVTTLWSGGVAPASGNASATDAYLFTIIKTAATPTYTVFAAGPVKYA